MKAKRKTLFQQFLFGFILILLVNFCLASLIALNQARAAVADELRYQLNAISERAVADYQQRQLNNLGNAQWANSSNSQTDSLLSGIRIYAYQPAGGVSAYDPNIGWSDPTAADLIGTRAFHVLSGQRVFWLTADLACLAVPVRLHAGQMAILLTTLPRRDSSALLAAYGWPTLLIMLAVSLPTLGLAWFVFRRLTRPVSQMVQNAEAIAQGDYRPIRIAGPAASEINLLRQALAQMSERLAANDQARKLVLSGLSHELRTPLTTIKANVQAMQDGIIRADEQAGCLADTVSEIDRLRGLVDNLLLAANPAAVWQIRRQSADFTEQVRLAVRQMQIRAEQTGIKLATDLPDTAPAELDVNQIRQLLFNLLDNAIRYCPAEGTIRIMLQRRDHGWLLSVWNAGPAIPDDLLKHIFEPLVKGPQSTGSGLGLYLCRRIAEAHQGRIDLKSDTVTGTTATVWLPGSVAGNDPETIAV